MSTCTLQTAKKEAASKKKEERAKKETRKAQNAQIQSSLKDHSVMESDRDPSGGLEVTPNVRVQPDFDLTNIFAAEVNCGTVYICL